jgi:hypothetical protein
MHSLNLFSVLVNYTGLRDIKGQGGDRAGGGQGEKWPSVCTCE